MLHLLSLVPTAISGTCNNSKQRFVDNDCCGESGDKAVCVAPSLDLESRLDAVSAAVELLSENRLSGYPKSKLAPDLVDIAWSAALSADSVYDDIDFAMEFAVDHVETTSWASNMAYCDASFTMTFDSAKTITVVGAQSRDMFTGVNPKNSSVIKSFTVEADGLELGVCTLPDWRQPYFCTLPRPVSAFIWTFKAKTCNPKKDIAFENQGFVEVSLMERPPADNRMQINDLPQCASIATTTEVPKWPPTNQLFDGTDISIWNVNEYLPGKGAFRHTVSGAWLCAVAHQSVDSTYAAVVALMTGTHKDQFKQAPASGVGESQFFPRTDDTQDFMPRLNSWCSDAVFEMNSLKAKLDLTILEKTRLVDVDVRVYMCEAIYINAALYRAEAYHADIDVDDDADSYVMEGGRLSKEYIGTLFGAGVCKQASCEIQIGPMTVQYPLQRYLYTTRMGEMAELAKSSDFAAAVAGGTNIFGPIATSIYDSHMLATLDGGQGQPITSLLLPVLDKYPKNYEICATTKAFFDWLREDAKSASDGEALVCKSLVQKLLKSYTNLFQIEKDMIHKQNKDVCLDTARFDMEVQGQGYIWNAIIPYSVPHQAFSEMEDGLALGLWGVAHLDIDTYLTMYAWHQSIMCLHLKRFDDFCAATQAADPVAFQPYGPGYAALYGVQFGKFYSASQQFRWNPTWDSTEDAAQIKENKCYAAANTTEAIFCSMHAQYWFTEPQDTCLHSAHVSSIYLENGIPIGMTPKVAMLSGRNNFFSVSGALNTQRVYAFPQ